MSEPDPQSPSGEPEEPPAEAEPDAPPEPSPPAQPPPATIEELGGEPPCQLPRFWDPDEE